MDKEIVKQLRSLSHIQNKQKTWIYDLSDGQLYDLFEMIKWGDSAKQIAKNIKEFWGIKPKSSVHSLSQGILKFKDRIFHLISPQNPKDLIQCPEVPEPFQYNHIEGLETNLKIASDLRKRIQRQMKEEEELKIPHPFLNKDVQALASLEKVILKMEEFNIKNSGKHPLEKDQERKKYQEFDNTFKNLMKKICPTEEDKIKMMNGCDQFVEQLEKSAIMLTQNDDGTFDFADSKGVSIKSFQEDENY